jgi:hypothetical protein
MATTIIGSLALNPLLPIQARGAGQISWGPVAVPAGYTNLTIQIDLQQVSSLTAAFSTNGDLSFDGGVSWPINFGATGLDLAQSGYRLVNGVLTRAVDDPMGPGAVRVFGFRFPLFQCDLTTRQVRGVLSCTEALISGATFVAF